MIEIRCCVAVGCSMVTPWSNSSGTLLLPQASSAGIGVNGGVVGQWNESCDADESSDGWVALPQAPLSRIAPGHRMVFEARNADSKEPVRVLGVWWPPVLALMAGWLPRHDLRSAGEASTW